MELTADYGSAAVSGVSILIVGIVGLTPAARHGRRICTHPGHVDPSVHNVVA